MPGPYADGVPEMKDFPELHGRRFIAVTESETRDVVRRALIANPRFEFCIDWR
jgi:hypothetical protein